MSKCKFIVKENNAVGRHSFYASHVPTGKLSFDEAIKFACKNTDIEESSMKKDITEFMRTVQDFVMMGYRVDLGDQFLTIYPVISASAKDEVNKQTGEVIKAATADMVKASMKGATSRLGCSVSNKFSKRFDMEVSWQKVDAKGNEVDDENETDITQNNDPAQGGDNNQGGSDNGGDNGGQGSGGLE